MTAPKYHSAPPPLDTSDPSPPARLVIGVGAESKIMLYNLHFLYLFIYYLLMIYIYTFIISVFFLNNCISFLLIVRINNIIIIMVTEVRVEIKMKPS